MQRNSTNRFFQAQSEMKDNIGLLIGQTKDVYSASLPLIASAELGDQRLYFDTLTTAIRSLYNLDNNPAPGREQDWMQNNGFKAWMWGRILLSADQMLDVAHVVEAQEKITTLLKSETTHDQNLAFYTWARAYLASLDDENYQTQRDAMIRGATDLTDKYNVTHAHGDLSNAVWAWVMNLQAAARNQDHATYELIKSKLLEISDSDSLSACLQQTLLRTADSNDYPAWALVIVKKAAVNMGDEALATALREPVAAAIQAAKNAGQTAEYTIANLANGNNLYENTRVKKPTP